MNILYLTNHLNAGGITSYLLTLVKGVRAQGHHITLCSRGGDLESVFEAEGAEVYRVNLNTKSELSPKIVMAIPVIKKICIRRDIDVIHSHTRITQVIGKIISNTLGCAYVSTCHGYFKKRLGRRLFPCWGEEVIAISKQVMEHLEDDFKVRPDVIKLVESGIDIAHFSSKDNYAVTNIRDRFADSNTKLIGLIGRLSDVKGQDVLIKTMAEIVKIRTDVRCLLVGQGKFEAELIALIERLNLSEYVEIVPAVNDTRNYLHAFDAAVMPSRQEGLGLSILEAQAAGCPVVATNVGGIPSIIEHEVSGLLATSENYHQLAEHVLRLLDDSQLRKDVKEKAYAQVSQKFSSERMVEEVVAIYERLIKQRILQNS